MTKAIGRRTTLTLGAAAALAGTARAAAPPEVEIGLLVPLTGPWAYDGQQEKLGAEMAVDDVNRTGGIRSLGGAKLRLVLFDTGSTAETAKDAAQRMIANHPNLSGGIGCWLSTFTLAATEVSERAKLPWLTLSYSDAITNRGFHYVFQTSPTGNAQAEQTVPVAMKLAEAATGKRPKKVAVVGDNTAASVSFLKPLLGHILKDQNLDLVVKNIYTPPLADATTLVQPVRAARPDFVLLLSTNGGDDKILADTFSEYGMPGSKMPLIGNGGHFANPELLKAAGPAVLEDIMIGLANWPGKDLGDLSARFVKRTGQPWFGHDNIFAYAHVMIFAWALNQAASADREKVATAIRTMNITDGPAIYFPGHHIQFDEKGRRVGAELVIVQWRNGRPVTVFPEDMAVDKAVWPVAS
ncbi:MAG TPA: ABC transporter substrate-binding protein [Acetobacteraceae bacterium]|nr:ABC transporter substrate-binding protein [Acetobacteraceae bacterium]